jgi:hypothetical protein
MTIFAAVFIVYVMGALWTALFMADHDADYWIAEDPARAIVLWPVLWLLVAWSYVRDVPAFLVAWLADRRHPDRRIPSDDWRGR